MLRWERIRIGLDEWNGALEDFADRTLFQSSSWLRFLKETVGGELVFAMLRDGSAELGYFAGMIVTKFGMRILGSPLPGWTTSYMGVVLQPEVSRVEALAALKRFAFEDLKCVHMEIMDRRIESRGVDSGYRVRHYNGYEIDLSLDEDRLFSNFAPACRRCIRKASRCGVAIEEAHDADFASDYYEQLKEVFARQGLSPTYSLKRVQALIRHLGQTGNLLLLRAFNSERRCIATGVFPAMNDRAYFWGGASRREDQHLRPNESLMWYALRYWKSRSIHYFDLGGSGEYKRKYGGQEISVPWLRVSRYPFLPAMRNGAMLLAKLRQRGYGAWRLVHSERNFNGAACTPSEAADA